VVVEEQKVALTVQVPDYLVDLVVVEMVIMDQEQVEQEIVLHSHQFRDMMVVMVKKVVVDMVVLVVVLVLLVLSLDLTGEMVVMVFKLLLQDQQQLHLLV
jgi:hypothetical protein